MAVLRLTFHGGAGTVTGSRHLLELGSERALIDCGLFQGKKELRLRNWEPPGFSPRSLSSVVLTHAHIDHSGYLPRLVRDGYSGPVYVTPATAELAELLLPDSAAIQEEDARHANEKGYSKHHPALPLYTVTDAERALALLERLPFGERARLSERLAFHFVRAGHILGSAMVQLEARVAHGEQPVKVLFTGDIGRYDAPLAVDPTPPEPCDYLVCESTYGDRLHPVAPVEDQLAEALRGAIERGGTVLVPSFAVGRAQQILIFLHRTFERFPALELPVHLDSPMAVDTTEIYRNHPEEKGLEAVDMLSGTSVIYGRNVYLHRTREESMRLNRLDGPRVIVSSSGMLAGGRVLHHARRLLPEEKNLVLLVGYQAPGTRGWRLERGEPTLRMHGQDVPVRAAVMTVSGLSAHADADQIERWLEDLPPPRRTFVVHGEPRSAQALARRLEERLGHRCTVPGLGDGYDLE